MNAPDKVEIATPQFERTNDLEVSYVPKDEEAFKALRHLPESVLGELGMQCWSGDIWLFPGEWYAHIPEGMEIIDINEHRETFSQETHSPDIRFGCLAYGIELGETLDEDEVDELFSDLDRNI
jgi:hypothetical protein